MTSKVTFFAAIATVALAACSPPAPQGGSDTSSDVVSSDGGSISDLQPGQWRTTMTILEMSDPLMSAVESQQMIDRPIVVDECKTAAEIQEMMRSSFVGEDDGETCSENTLNLDGGRVEGRATCTASDGMTRRMEMSGSYTPTHIEVNISDVANVRQGQQVKRMHLVSERIGDCPG